MPVNKPHLEFHAVDMAGGWTVPFGYPAGIEHKILAGALDETGKTGSRTRLLRFAPGVFTTAPFGHDYWEEVHLIDGDPTVGNDAHGRGTRTRRCARQTVPRFIPARAGNAIIGENPPRPCFPGPAWDRLPTLNRGLFRPRSRVSSRPSPTPSLSFRKRASSHPRPGAPAWS